MCAWQLYFTSSSFKWSMKTIGNNLICLNMWFSGKVFHDMIFFYHLTLNIQYMIWIKIYNNACQVYFKYKKDSRILFCWCSFTHAFSSLVRLWLIRFYFNTLLERIFFSYFFFMLNMKFGNDDGIHWCTLYIIRSSQKMCRHYCLAKAFVIRKEAINAIWLRRWRKRWEKELYKLRIIKQTIE